MVLWPVRVIMFLDAGLLRGATKAEECEFALVTQSLKIAGPEDLEKVDFAQELAVGLSSQVKALGNTVASFYGGRRQVISHDLALHGNTPIVTCLLRRAY